MPEPAQRAFHQAEQPPPDLPTEFGDESSLPDGVVHPFAPYAIAAQEKQKAARTTLDTAWRVMLLEVGQDLERWGRIIVEYERRARVLYDRSITDAASARTDGYRKSVWSLHDDVRAGRM